jgi:hypothetical protein
VGFGGKSTTISSELHSICLDSLNLTGQLVTVKDILIVIAIDIIIEGSCQFPLD